MWIRPKIKRYYWESKIRENLAVCPKSDKRYFVTDIFILGLNLPAEPNRSKERKTNHSEEFKEKGEEGKEREEESRCEEEEECGREDDQEDEDGRRKGKEKEEFTSNPLDRPTVYANQKLGSSEDWSENVHSEETMTTSVYIPSLISLIPPTRGPGVGEINYLDQVYHHQQVPQGDKEFVLDLSIPYNISEEEGVEPINPDNEYLINPPTLYQGVTNAKLEELSTKPSDSEDKSKTTNTEEGKEFEYEHERESKTKDCEDLKEYKSDLSLASEETKLEKNDAKFECSETQLDLDKCSEKIKGDDIQQFDKTDSNTAEVVEDIYREEELGNENNEDKEDDTFSIEDDIKIESKESTENDLEEIKESRDINKEDIEIDTAFLETKNEEIIEIKEILKAAKESPENEDTLVY